MCSCHSILECCVMFSGVKLSIRSFVLFLWAYKTMKQREINIRSWKAWRRANPTYCKSFPRIMVEEKIEKMRELIVKARIR